MSRGLEASTAAALVVLAVAAPAVAQPADLSQGRTGPQSTPPPTPSFAQPAPGLAPAAPSAGPAGVAPTGGTPVTDLRITVSGPHRDAVPPPAFHPR
mgnify:CR=1 FL=1